MSHAAKGSRVLPHTRLDCRIVIVRSALAAAAVLVAGLALPWESGGVRFGGDMALEIKWLVVPSALFLTALSNVRSERTNALFLLGPMALIGSLVLHWFTVERLAQWHEGPALSPGLVATMAGVLLLAWALWQNPRKEPAPPAKG
ncbi:hypothetical protein IIA16_01790 [bacterium]|nr:hypothetical protein [bacterium]